MTSLTSECGLTAGRGWRRRSSVEIELSPQLQHLCLQGLLDAPLYQLVFVHHLQHACSTRFKNSLILRRLKTVGTDVELALMFLFQIFDLRAQCGNGCVLQTITNQNQSRARSEVSWALLQRTLFLIVCSQSCHRALA